MTDGTQFRRLAERAMSNAQAENANRSLAHAQAELAVMEKVQRELEEKVAKLEVDNGELRLRNQVPCLHAYSV